MGRMYQSLPPVGEPGACEHRGVSLNVLDKDGKGLPAT